MISDLYTIKDDKKLRCGFTTGSCAAAAAKAALCMLLDDKELPQVSIMTPKGITYIAEVVDIVRDKDQVSCSVIKDGGDDVDATDGMKIRASVRLCDGGEILIDGGEGIGRVTKPGLDQKIGEAAINSVPRRMIRDCMLEVLSAHGMTDVGASVIISAPEGERVAEKTFNSKLGIIGGIAILGTTGIVEPMSDEGILGTIRAQISMQRAMGKEVFLMAPGNYGLKFIQDTYDIGQDRAVLCSNFVYDTLAMAAEAGFREVLFVGHLGKLIKVAGDIKNTHSKYGDHRMEILCDVVSEFALGPEFEKLKQQLEECVMTDEAVRIITGEGLREKVFSEVSDRIRNNMESWIGGSVRVEDIIFEGDYSFLSGSTGARQLLERIRGEE
jgi:cobalt-precorrin-5B (C1)-methyltransferase